MTLRTHVMETAEEYQAQFNQSVRGIPLGSIIKPYGEVVAVGYMGERYYWLLDDLGTVSMICGDVVEKMAESAFPPPATCKQAKVIK